MAKDLCVKIEARLSEATNVEGIDASCLAALTSTSPPVLTPVHRHYTNTPFHIDSSPNSSLTALVEGPADTRSVSMFLDGTHRLIEDSMDVKYVLLRI
jgi:hypothetical protein